ncbi:MAG TPA: cache domain-containing protein, partial [Bradyrhizobium sp.]|nr:cache domain-containing protein [Bradyrhizobium sp.]
MNGVEQKFWFLRGGLFAKYVIALVGLVVFVLAVNGAVETWISYRATKTTLTDAMGEKAEATARRIEQSISELERQIGWVTRASATARDNPTRTLENHYADYVQLLNQVPAINQLSLLDGQGREQLRLSRTTVVRGSGVDFSRDVQMTEAFARGVSYAPAFFRGIRPFMSIAVSHSGADDITLAEIDLRLLSDFFGDAQVGKVGFAYLIDLKGQVLASSAKGPDVARDLSRLPQVAAILRPDRRELASGTDDDRHAVLTASNAVLKLGWFVFFEQPTAQALAPIRDQLARIALLISLGLAVAILAGTVMARRMLVPITALRTGA